VFNGRKHRMKKHREGAQGSLAVEGGRLERDTDNHT